VHAASPRPGPDREGPLVGLIYYGYLAGSLLARALPERLAYPLARVAGTLGTGLLPRKKKIVARNLSRITGYPLGSPQLERLVREAFGSYTRYWLETFRLVRKERDFFLERFHCRGQEHLAAVLERDGGALIVVGHLGNWDAAAGWLAATGHHAVTAAERLRPRKLFDFFVANRARLGATVYPAERGTAGKLVDAIKDGAVVAVLGDRDLNGRGPEVSFFGAPATFPGGPAAIALRAGVPILVAGIYGARLPDRRRGWEAEIAPPIDLPKEIETDSVAQLTCRIAERLEDFVARRPEEWHVFQPFWIEDRTAT
jgi:phosphatidylinositol dimannoside acyltransferase